MYSIIIVSFSTPDLCTKATVHCKLPRLPQTFWALRDSTGQNWHPDCLTKVLQLAYPGLAWSQAGSSLPKPSLCHLPRSSMEPGWICSAKTKPLPFFTRSAFLILLMDSTFKEERHAISHSVSISITNPWTRLKSSPTINFTLLLCLKCSPQHHVQYKFWN